MSGLGSFVLFAARSAGVARAPARGRAVRAAGGGPIALVPPEPQPTARAFRGSTAPSMTRARGAPRPLGPAGLGGGMLILFPSPQRAAPAQAPHVAVPPAAYVLTVDAGIYTSTGQPVGLAVAAPVASGAYAMTGQPVALVATVPAAAGSYALTGQPAGLSVALPASAGSYVLAGQATALRLAAPAATGSYTLTGEPVGYALALAVDPGVYVLTGEAVALALTLPDVGAVVARDGPVWVGAARDLAPVAVRAWDVAPHTVTARGGTT